jgi:hypothetical protein
MNPWLRLLSDIFKFCSLVLSRPRLLLFLIVFVIGIGGIGIWIPLYKCDPGKLNLELDVYRSLATYLIAIAISSFAERFFLRKPEYDQRNLMIFAFGLGAVAVVAGIVMLTQVQFSSKWVGMGTGATLWLWFIALGDSPAFEEANANSAIGGNL